MRLRPVRSRRSPLFAFSALTALAAGCGERSGGIDIPLEEGILVARCPGGRLLNADGACMPVGVQGCVDLFLGDDNLCHPAMTRCPSGAIPKLDEGCVPVGIPGCAPGFLDEAGLCRPAMAKCPQGMFAAPGEGCVPVDGPDGCGAGRWGSIPDGSGIIHVDLGYPGVDSDGSRARPMTSLAAAMEVVEDGGTIALADGSYDEPVVVTRPLALVGRCPSRVRLQGARAAGGLPAIVSVLGAKGVTLRGLEIGGDGVGVAVSGTSEVAIERVHLKNSTDFGVAVEGAGAQVSIAQSFIEGTRAGELGDGIGVLVEGGATLTLLSSAITGNRIAGIAIKQAGTKVSVIGSLVEGTLPSEGSYEGQGIVVDGADASIENSAVVGNRMTGVLAMRGGSATLSGVLIEGTLPGPEDASYGLGAYASMRGHLSIASSALLGNAEAGVAVVGVGTTAEMTGSLVQATVAPALGQLGGVGVLVARGATMRLDDSTVWQNHTAGVVVVGAPAALDATGNLIGGTLSARADGDGLGVSVVGGRVTLTSNTLRDNQGAGLSIGDPDSEATVIGNLVEGHLTGGGPTAGRGIQVIQGARAALSANVVSDSRVVGLLVADDPGSDLRGAVEMIDGLVQRTSGDETDDSSGVGVAVAGAHLTLASSIIRESRSAGIALFAAAAVVRGTVVSGVAGGGEGAAPGRSRGGDGVLAQGGSTLDLIGVRVDGCARAGVLYDSSAGSLSRVRASDNLFGLVVQGSQRPDVGEDNVFVDNTTMDEQLDGDLSVLVAPPPLP